MRPRVSACMFAFALACGPSVTEDGDSSGGDDDGVSTLCAEPPYDDACLAAFAQRCEKQPDPASCVAVEALPGGVALQCSWVEPERIVDPQTCEMELAEPRCVGVAYPGDIGCSPFLEDDGGVLVTVPDACFPIGWGECDDADAPEACDCING